MLAILAYGIIGAQSALTLRAVRWALPNDPVAQERIIGTYLSILAFADVRQFQPTLAPATNTLASLSDHTVSQRPRFFIFCYRN